jgi:hypothetical protein
MDLIPSKGIAHQKVTWGNGFTRTVWAGTDRHRSSVHVRPVRGGPPAEMQDSPTEIAAVFCGK